MANTIPNQPIIFDYSDDCLLASDDLTVMAQHGDLTQFQMKLEPCGNDVNIVQGGNFQDPSLWVASGGWTVSGGSACHAIGVSGVLSQLAPATNGTLARLRLTVESATDGGGVVVSWGNYTQGFESGTHEVWINADSVNTFAIATSGSTAVCVRDLQLITVNTEFRVDILDEDDTLVNTLLPSDGFFDFADGYFTATIDWEGLDILNGCYTLAVIDPCYCSQLGFVALDLLTGSWNWSAAAVWTIGSGNASFNGSSTGVALLANSVCSGVTYEVTYRISNVIGTVDIEVGFGSTYGTVRTSDGTYTEQITSNGTGFRFKGTPTGAASFEIDQVSFNAIASDIQSTKSNKIKVKKNLDGCTLALAMCNDSNAFGFGFENTNFRPLMRIPASLNRSSYIIERLSYDNSRGRKYTYYGRHRKALELGYDGKYFMHDFASLFGLADHFYIDDVEYFVEDDEYPSISWGEYDDIGGVTLNVSEKVQLVENRRLSSASVGCEPQGALILDNNDLPIVDVNDERITTP